MQQVTDHHRCHLDLRHDLCKDKIRSSTRTRFHSQLATPKTMLGSTSRALAMPTTALRSRGLATDSSPRKIVLVGAGFLASYIARALIADPRNRVLLVSRNPKPSMSCLLLIFSVWIDLYKSQCGFTSSLVLSLSAKTAVYDKLSHLGSQILPPQSADITDPSSLNPVLKDASAVVSLVGVLVGNAKVMEKVQKEGAENVAKAAREEGVGRVVMISAIGADSMGVTP